MSDDHHDKLPDELEALRNALGRGLHQEVKEELKEEAARPGRLRTKIYATLGVLLMAGVILGLGLMWPARNARQPAVPSGVPGSRNPITVVRRAMDGPEGGPYISLNNREAVEGRRQTLEHDLALEAFLALDAARKAREEFEGTVNDALSSDAGRHVAASDDLVMRYRVIIEDRELAAGGKSLDALPQAGVPDRTGADNATARYRKALFNLGVLFEHAKTTRPMAASTLGEAVTRQRERESLREIEIITEKEQEARKKALEKAAADAEKKVREEEERKRWGVVKPGATWKGTLTDRGEEYRTEVMITARNGDAIEGTNTWIAPDGVVHGLAFTGTCKGDTI